MDIYIPSGKYIIAVSGGVDSMTLLFLISKLSPETHSFIVAHFDHGIREDSKLDLELVAKATRNYDLILEHGSANLGAAASEQKAREARMKFLFNIKNKYKADKIITAHHQDDLIETALINTLRGTKRRGLSALLSSQDFIRPLINYNKKEILNIANKNNIKWREDFTNSENKYLRNYIRNNILIKLSKEDRAELIMRILDQHKLNTEIEDYLNQLTKSEEINRELFASLDYEIAKEVILAWLRNHGLYSYDKNIVERITNEALTKATGKKIDVSNNVSISISKNTLKFL